ncbi:rRNA maturation RNase YbeY [Brytella acorum]|uniref:Endoribonuclease YbeY n=1 Tax=Brytella acorum TaxID=2959299 RepID=A0AA35Y3C4_9PROT|nr:rRNA maturation RNase YbeY [Brytella acorum]MDF3624200.1 rRNA maturation RNase YbeY [Brytella acorum]CAI9120706.1 rRNA maturation RNase YbeY [Brytella acorum]
MEPRSRHTHPIDLAPEPSWHEIFLPAQPEILIADRRWRRSVPDVERRVLRALQAANDWLGVERAPTVLLETDRAVKRLNHVFRGKNKPTNVLTFEATTGSGGDIALGFDTVRREARAARRTIGHHLAHLVVHGSLHLGGYDHHHPGEAREMESAEARILHRIGVPNPWRPGRSLP